MKITSALFAAFLKCPTRCFLLSQGEECSGNAYAEWVRAREEAYRKEVIAGSWGSVTAFNGLR